MHPNLQGDKFPFFIIFKNEKPFCYRSFRISMTINIGKSWIFAITKCCSDRIEDFNSKDIIYFYLDQALIDSLTKVRIKSQIFAEFIEILDYLASKCGLINCKNCAFPLQGIPQNEETLIVRPSQSEFKNSIKGYVNSVWINKFSKTNQTKTFISEPSESVSKDLMELPKQYARNVVAFLTGFGPFLKHLYKIDPVFYETDKCPVWKEGGSV